MKYTRLLLTLLCALPGAVLSMQTARAAEAERPNIVFILADDMGYGDVRAYNAESKVPTPHLDKLAKQGMRFTDAHSPSAVCTPTRYGTLTGRYCWRTRLKSGVLGGYSAPLIDRDRSTVATMLGKHGYHTAAIGKWHLGMDMPKRLNADVQQQRWDGDGNVDYAGKIADGPTARGFDYYFGNSASLDMAPYVWIENDRFTSIPTIQQAGVGFPDFIRKGPRSEDFVIHNVLDTLGDKAAAYIAQRAKTDKPFFLYISRFRNVSIRDVMETCVFGGWVETRGGEVICTPGGHCLLDRSTVQYRLRDQIHCFLMKENPLWASSAVQGRQALVSYAPPEAVQCFREAGLLDGQDEDVVSWWDELAGRFRAVQDEAYLQIGRKGERMSIEWEHKRTGVPPRWIALEFNDAGYDIVSRLAHDDSTRLVIEVKSSTLPWEHAELFLSRAEWEVLIREQHALIHLWSLCNTPPRHAAIAIDQLREHVPSDVGSGSWYRCRIPFAAFDPHPVDLSCPDE